MFIALLEQEAEGCDYTIACGKDWIYLEAENKTGARIELRDRIIGVPNEDYSDGFDGYYLGENKLGNAVLLEVLSESEINLREWYEQEEARRKKKKKEMTEKKEKATYQRLKTKYAK